MEYEARALKRALRHRGDCEVVTIGVRANRLPSELGVTDVVIMAGLAGGLAPSLNVGDVVIDSLSDISLVELSYPRAAIHTAGAIVSTPAERAKLFAETGAWAVEMENERVRRFAKAAAARYVGVRAISDSARETLTPAVARFVDDAGRVKPMALARELVRRPMLAVELNALRKASTLAVKNLARAVREIVEHISR